MRPASERLKAEAPLKVLVVEDEVLIGMDLVMLLEEWGYTADGPVKSVQSALESVKAAPPDLAILDVNLGDGRTSIPIAARLAEMNIPFVFLTGYDPSRYDDVSTAPNAPHLRKPLDQQALRDLISEITRRPR